MDLSSESLDFLIESGLSRQQLDLLIAGSEHKLSSILPRDEKKLSSVEKYRECGCHKKDDCKKKMAETMNINNALAMFDFDKFWKHPLHVQVLKNDSLFFESLFMNCCLSFRGDLERWSHKSKAKLLMYFLDFFSRESIPEGLQKHLWNIPFQRLVDAEGSNAKIIAFLYRLEPALVEPCLKKMSCPLECSLITTLYCEFDVPLNAFNSSKICLMGRFQKNNQKIYELLTKHVVRDLSLLVMSYANLIDSSIKLSYLKDAPVPKRKPKVQYNTSGRVRQMY